MTTGTVTLPVVYQGDGLSNTFPLPFYFASDTEVLVFMRAAAAADLVQLTLGLDYTLLGAGAAAGGSIILLATPAVGAILALIRRPPLTQLSDYRPYDALPAERVESDLDLRARVDQWLAMEAARAIKVPIDEPTPPPLEPLTVRANKPAWFADHGGIVSVTPVPPPVSLEPGDAVSVLAYGATGNGSINDLPAVQAAFNAAIGNGSRRVFFPPPPDPEGWYYLNGDIRGVAECEAIFLEGAAVNGPTNLFGDQTLIRGAYLWRAPGAYDVTVKADDGRYSHQWWVGTDLDDEWILPHQYHPTERREGQDGQLVGYYKSMDGGAGQLWSDVVPFATEYDFSTNPIQNTEPAGQRFTLWRCKSQRFDKPHGLGSKLWLFFDHPPGSTIGSSRIAQKTSADGKLTNYGFVQLGDSRIKLIRYGDPLPEGASYRWSHEGRDGLFPYCHSVMISSRGRLHILFILSQGGQAKSRKMPVVLVSDNAEVMDPEEMEFRLGPSIDLGDMDPANVWELSMEEVERDFFEITIRRNESTGSASEQEGRRHYVAHGDGLNFSGFKSMGILAHRDRPSLVRWNHEYLAYITLDDPNSRANTSVWLQRKHGAMTPGLRVGNNTDFFRRSDRITADRIGEDGTATPTISFDDANIGATQWRSGGERVELAGEGYVAAWDEQRIDLGHVDYSVGDHLVGEQGALEETIVFTSPGDKVHALENEFSEANPLVRMFGVGVDDTVPPGSGGFLLATGANSSITFGKDVPANGFAIIHQTGVQDTHLFESPGDTIWDLSAEGSSLTIAEGSFAATLFDGSPPDSTLLYREPTRIVEALDFLASTAGPSMTFLMDRSSTDQVEVNGAGGELTAVPTGARHPTTGALGIVFGAKPLLAPPGPGATSGRFTVIPATGAPRTDLIPVVPRAISITEAGPDHQWSYSEATGILDLPGRTTAGVVIPAGRGQIAIRFRLTALPSSADRAKLVQFGSFECHASLEASWKSPSLRRELYMVYGGAGSQDVALGSPISRRFWDLAVDDGEGGYTARDDAWVTTVIQYDTFLGQVTWEGQVFSLQPPYALTVGDGWQLSRAPASQVLKVQVEGEGGIAWTRLPAAHRGYGRPWAPAHVPNLFPDPSLLQDPERQGSAYPNEAPRAGPLGWSVADRGGCTVNLRRITQSITASNQQRGGERNFLQLSITGARRQPASAATGPVKLQHSWPGINALKGGEPWSLMFDCEDALSPDDPFSAVQEGLGVRLYAVHNYGRPHYRQKVYPLFPVRVLRDQRRPHYLLPQPQVEESSNLLIGPGAYTAIWWVVEAGYNAVLNISRPDLYQDDRPRPFGTPDPLEAPKTVRLYYERTAKFIDVPMSPLGRIVDASTAELVLPLPDMVRPPTFNNGGSKWGLDYKGSTYDGAVPSLRTATEDRAVVDFNVPGATFTVGDPAAIVGRAKKTVEHESDGTGLIYPATDNMYVQYPDDVKVYAVEGDGTASELTLYSDYDVRPSFEPQWTSLSGSSGSSVLTGRLPVTGLTRVEVADFGTTIGEAIRTHGVGFTGTVVDGSLSVTLLDATGDAMLFESGHGYQARIGAKTTQCDVILSSPLPGTSTVRIEHQSESSDRLGFDARVHRPIWSYRAATEALYDAFADKPGRERKDAYDRLIASLQDEGIWELLDVLHVPAAHSQADAALNLIDPSVNSLLEFNNPIHVVDRGYRTNGIDAHLQADWSPSDGPGYAQDDACMGWWIWSVAAGVGQAVGGASGGGVTTSVIPADATSSPPAAQHRINASSITGIASIRGSDTTGLIAVERDGAASHSYFAQGANGVLRRAAASVSSTGVPSGRMMTGRYSSAYGAIEVAMSYAGRALGLLLQEKLRRIIEQYLTDIGSL